METTLKSRRALSLAESRALADLTVEILDRNGKPRPDADPTKKALFAKLCARANAPSNDELRAEARRLVDANGYTYLGSIEGPPGYGAKIGGLFCYLQKEIVTTARRFIGDPASETFTHKRGAVFALLPDGELREIGGRLSDKFAARLNKKL